MKGLVYLGVKVAPGPIRRRPVIGYDFEKKLAELKDEASKDADLPSDHLNLIYRGKILEDDKTLDDYGVKFGEVIFVYKKYIPPETDSTPRISEIEVQECVSFFRSFINPAESAVTLLLQLRENAHSEDFISSSKSLRDDLVAINFLREPELMAHMGDPETIRKVAEKHPAIIEAVKKLSSFKVTKAPTTRSVSLFRSPDSDDEEDVDIIGDTDDDGDGSGNEGNTSGMSFITPEQLSSALALAAMTRNSGNSTRSSNSTSDDSNLRDLLGSLLNSDRPSTSTPSTSRPVITNDMFSNALTQALVTGTSATSSSDTPTTSMETNESNNQQYASQLQQMNEMGLTNNTVNLRALMISDGDVNSAINLVLNNLT